MTFGEKVRSLRKEKKMSQQELASMVGVSYRTIRSWEVEGRFPKQNVLYQKPDRLSRFWNRLQLCLPVDH